MAHPGGRPTKYTHELAQEICEAIANGSKGLPKLCEDNPHWPETSTIRDWKKNNKEFSDMYAKAKVDQIETIVEEILTIADDTSKDNVVTENGIKCNGEWVNRSRLRIDTRKWLAAKLAPRIYGDKINLMGSVGLHQEDALSLLE